MKKEIFKRARTAALGLGLCLLAAVLPAAAAVKPDYVIRENFFAGMITDIFMNMSDYKGKTIQYEGFVMPIDGEAFGEGPETFAVVRIAVCCGPDDMPIGFACMGKDAPPENAWVRVTGVLRERDLNNGEDPYPYLDVRELEVLTKRGKQKVAL